MNGKLRKNLKKIIGLCVCIILIAGLAACGCSSGDDEAADKKTEAMKETGNKVVTTENTAENSTENTADTTEKISTTEDVSATEEPVTTEAETTTETMTTQQPVTETQNGNNGGVGATAHGALRVQGTDLVDANGNKFQLYGMSTHGMAWFPQFVNYEAFKTLRDDWNTNCVRLAMYTHEYNGYCSGGNKEELKQLVKKGVDYATQLGMYVIVDWHVLNDNDPNRYKEEAKNFFDEISSKYAGQSNIIYEICNEPCGGTSWESIKSYAGEVIPVIRANDPDAVIIVGTPNWSQEIDKALASPLAYDNVMYALHFYAATHTDWLRDRLEQCKNNGLPVFISEFGLCDASGNGAIDYNQSAQWMDLIDRYNLSYCSWSLSNKAETCSVIASWCQKTSGWDESDLSEAGKYIRNRFRNEN